MYNTMYTRYWNCKGNWITRDCFRDVFEGDIDDDVKGYITSDEWIRIVNWCADIKKGE